MFVSDDDSDGDSLVIPIELKKGALKASQVQSQLQGGAQFAEEIIRPTSKPIRFIPVAVGGRHKTHRKQHDRLRQKKNWVRFSDQEKLIVVLNCGEPLTEAINR